MCLLAGTSDGQPADVHQLGGFWGQYNSFANPTDFSSIHMVGNPDIESLSLDEIRVKYQSGEIYAQPTDGGAPFRLVATIVGENWKGPLYRDYLMVSLTCSGQKEFFIGSNLPYNTNRFNYYEQNIPDSYQMTYAELSTPTDSTFCNYGSVEMAGSMTVKAGTSANHLSPCQGYVSGQPTGVGDPTIPWINEPYGDWQGGEGARTFAIYNLMAWAGEAVPCTSNTDMDVPTAPPGCGRDPILAPPPPSPPPLLPPPTSPSSPPTPPIPPSPPPTPPAEIPLDCMSGNAPATTSGADRYNKVVHVSAGYDWLTMDGNFDELSIDDIRYKYQSGELKHKKQSQGGSGLPLIVNYGNDYLLVTLTLLRNTIFADAKHRGTRFL